MIIHDQMQTAQVELLNDVLGPQTMLEIVDICPEAAAWMDSLVESC